VSKRTTAVAAWESLFRAQVTVMRRLQAEFPSEIISLNEYDVMFNLSRQPGHQLRLKDLNTHVLITQPSVSRLVDRLTARGYLAKSDDPADGRGTIVSLTDSGFEVFRRVALEHMESISGHMGDGLDAEELAQLTALCDKLRSGVAATD